jgi:hypothetical protein
VKVCKLTKENTKLRKQLKQNMKELKEGGRLEKKE